MIDNIIKSRHTTRLMADEINNDDVDTILTSARLAPSKNRIYGYKIFALTNSEQGSGLKKRLCEHVTKYEEQGKGTIYLLQTLAPLVLIYMLDPAPEHQMVGINEHVGTEVYEQTKDQVKNDKDRYVMVKNSLRDAMISATYAQLTAEGLGLGTAFVACGLEDLIWDNEFAKFFGKSFGDDFRSRFVEPAVILCIGPKHPKITELYANGAEAYTETYLHGFTDLTRSGREKSFVINDKQKNIIDIV